VIRYSVGNEHNPADPWGRSELGLVSWDDPALPPGYAEVFDLIDAVIRQLSGDAVDYPTTRGPVVRGAVTVQPWV
jgi:hypothetical protein